MRIVALDPGPEYTGQCWLIDGAIGSHGWDRNSSVLANIRAGWADDAIAIIESPQAQDRPLGPQLRNTIWWAGRFAEALDNRGTPWHEAEERDVAFWLTGNRSANNAAVLQGLKTAFGDTTQEPCGNCHATGAVMGTKAPKKCPRCKGSKFLKCAGPLHGLNEHERSALAAAWWFSQKPEGKKQTA